MFKNERDASRKLTEAANAIRDKRIRDKIKYSDSMLRGGGQTCTGGGTTERGITDPVDAHGIADAHGRLMVVMRHNTDIPDTWEREGESQEYFDRFSPNGYAVGVNIMIYAMTH